MPGLLHHVSLDPVCRQLIVDQPAAARSVVEQHQRLALQFLPRHRRELCQRMVAPADQHERVVLNRFTVERLGVGRFDRQAEIHFAATHAVQHQGLHLVAQLHGQLGIVERAGGDALRHQSGG